MDGVWERKQGQGSALDPPGVSGPLDPITWRVLA